MASFKPRFAVAKVIFPGLSEGIVVTEGLDLFLVLLEANSPFTQGARVVVTEVVKSGRAEVGAFDGGVQGAGRVHGLLEARRPPTHPHRPGAAAARDALRGGAWRGVGRQ